MSRQAFGDWGAGLGDAQFANALAHLGTVDAQPSPNPTGGITLEWRGWWEQGKSFQEFTASFDPVDCANAWLSRWLQDKPVCVIVLLPDGDMPLDLKWLIQTLKSAIGVESVVFAPHQGQSGQSAEPPIRLDPASLASHILDGHLGIVGDVSILYEPGVAIEELDLVDEDEGADGAEREEEDADEMAATEEADSDQADVTTRYVQGQLFCTETSPEEQLRDVPLRANKRHRLDIRIGAPDTDWTTAPAVFPDHELPPHAQGHWLTVKLVAPALQVVRKSEKLWLPRTGNSRPCSFHFVADVSIGRLDATVVILYENRILQTLKVVASIGDYKPEQPLQIILQSVFEQDFNTLSSRRAFDASLLAATTSGSADLASFTNFNTAYLPSSDVDALIKDLRRQLEGITNAPDSYSTTESESTRKLLVTLAREGVGFRKRLFELMDLPLAAEPSTARTASPLRLQVVSLSEKDLLPIEFCYDRSTPNNDAALCSRWRDAVGKGTCACDRAIDEKSCVCPLAFWGLYHVIERKLWSKQDADQLRTNGAAFAVGSDTPSPLSSFKNLANVLFGSATKAASFDQAAFNATVTAIGDLLSERGSNLLEANTWDDWTIRIAVSRPDVLVIVGHTEKDNGAMTLQIGNESIPTEEIKIDEVRKPAPPAGVPGPLVLLFACRSADSDVPFSDLITAFRRARASMIVGTLSTVLGRHMAPCAKIALEVISARTNGTARGFGELLVEMRQRLLLANLPVGLTLVGYGDVDWQIGEST